MRYNVEEFDKYLSIKVVGEFSIFFKDELEKLVVDELAKKREAFIFDFSHVRYLDSSGLSILLLAANFTMRNNNLPVFVLNATEQSKYLLESSKTKNLIRVYDDFKDCVSYINEKKKDKIEEKILINK